jgi:hypothetical protein
MKEYKTTALKALTVGTDGKVVRLQFGTTESDVGLLIPASALPELIPVFLAGDIEAQQRVGTADSNNAFDVKQLAVKIPEDKRGVIVTMTIFQDLELSFRVDAKSARRFLYALVEQVAQSETATKTLPS